MNTRYTCLLLLFSTYTVSNQSIVLENFEQQNIRVINSSAKYPQNILWSQHDHPPENHQLGYESITSEEAYSGNKSLKVTVEKGHVYFHFYPHSASNVWDFMHQHTITKPWKFNTYNRLKFWVKLPPGIKRVGGGKQNTTFGTYYRKSNGKLNSAESGGNHPYHFYDLESTGEWHQIIVDTHPNHIRGVTGSREHGNRTHPTNEPNFNYFDSMTRFYFDMDGTAPNRPADFYFDNFELYTANPNENIKQIYSLNGVYIKDRNIVKIGWMRDKNENKVSHEVRYSFSDIYESGWDLALKAPSGIVKPSGWGGHNGMFYHTSKIPVEKHNTLYMAIKPENSDKFRQIEIPLNNLAWLKGGGHIVGED
ncbi:hypothetical protein [Paraglaciecola sp.]|uniref:hypothetical protein n=1 Tax=Paraglaciecola sp. TaxID=1920173 RepID=UPI003EF6006A